MLPPSPRAGARLPPGRCRQPAGTRVAGPRDPRRRADRGRRPEVRVASRRLARFAHPVRFERSPGLRAVGRQAAAGSPGERGNRRSAPRPTGSSASTSPCRCSTAGAARARCRPPRRRSRKLGWPASNSRFASHARCGRPWPISTPPPSRVTSLRDSVAESERVLHDERLKYEAGRSVINFVLDAESALLTSQSLLSQAERSVTTASLAAGSQRGTH